MAVGGAVLVAAWLGTAAASAPAAPQAADLARVQARYQALTAETPLAGTPLTGNPLAASPLSATPPALGTFAARASTSIRARMQAAEALLRRVGLDPQRFRATAVGGPYVPVNGAARPAEIGMADVAAMEAAIAAIPSYVPVKAYSFTSPFGVRYDPFNGRTAMHAGLDMAGQTGEPIYAAADGTVVTGGKSGAYGNLVEIDHGKGLATRYGHLSAILVQPGSHVRQGQLIARMGSTGRSTGTHLHYEIRLDGRAINPRPFLDASGFVLAAQGRGIEGPSVFEALASDDTATFSLAGNLTRN